MLLLGAICTPVALLALACGVEWLVERVNLPPLEYEDWHGVAQRELEE